MVCLAPLLCSAKILGIGVCDEDIYIEWLKMSSYPMGWAATFD
jgi:hypothetical protein